MLDVGSGSGKWEAGSNLTLICFMYDLNFMDCTPSPIDVSHMIVIGAGCALRKHETNLVGLWVSYHARLVPF